VYYRDNLIDKGEEVFEDYREAIVGDVARELARVPLPLGTYTKKVWMMNLHNLLHFLSLRTHEHAQWEIRQYANEIERFVEAAFPMTYSSWYNHVKMAKRFSADEWEFISALFDYGPDISDAIKGQFKGARRREFLTKIGRL